MHSPGHTSHVLCDQVIHQNISRLPVAVAAYAATSQNPKVTKWATMGAAMVRPDNSATSDYTLTADAVRPEVAGMALCQLLAKAVTMAPAGETASPLNVLYVIEQRALGVGLPEGALSVRLRTQPPFARLAISKAGGGRQRLRLPSMGRVADRPSLERSDVALRVAGGTLALLQALVASNPAATDRMQLCLQNTVPTVAVRYILHRKHCSLVAQQSKFCLCSRCQRQTSVCCH